MTGIVILHAEDIEPQNALAVDQTTIAKWLRASRITDNPEGRAIEVMRRAYTAHSDKFPEMFHSRAEMRDFLRLHSVYREALANLPNLWRRYRNWLDRHCWG